MEEKSDPERAKERGENVQFSDTEVELVHEVQLQGNKNEEHKAARGLNTGIPSPGPQQHTESALSPRKPSQCSTDQAKRWGEGGQEEMPAGKHV